MPKRTLKVGICGAGLAAAIVLLHHPQPVRAQAAQLQVASISAGPIHSLTWPQAAPAPYMVEFPDEHTTIFPPASSSAPYLLFGSTGAVSTSTGFEAQFVVLESTDLQTWKFANDEGYNPVVMSVVTPPSPNIVCSETTTFDGEYAGPGFVAQDPTLPPGNLVAVYEAENHCISGSYQANSPVSYSIGFSRSSDNGKTWPAPVVGPTGSPDRYPVLQTAIDPTAAQGDLLPGGGFIDKSLDGNYYLYGTYFSLTKTANGTRVARAQLGSDPVTFFKWYYGSFSQPGIGGLDSPVVTSATCFNGGANPGIYHIDDVGLYLYIATCSTPPGAAAGDSNGMYYSTATSLDLQDWSAPQLIANTQEVITACTGANPGAPAGNSYDGNYPSLMSPGLPPGHINSTGMIFFMDCVGNGTRTFKSRPFTITTQPQPAPVLTAGSAANAATYVAGGLVPGSWAKVLGTGLANTIREWEGFDFLNLGNNLPTTLSGVQVLVNSTPAALLYISPTQINFQVPTGITGAATIQVINNGAASNTIAASGAAVAPGLFPNTVNGVNYPAAINVTRGGYVGPDSVAGYHSAQPGNLIALYATGLVAMPGGILPTVQQLNGVTLTIGSVTVPASYAGQTGAPGRVPGQSHRAAAIRDHGGRKLPLFHRDQRRLLARYD